ncbi:SBBP repeat-containing protein, partial [Candidatus Latescibacterota bacterium]
LDSSDNVYVTGVSLGMGTSYDNDYATIKYDTNGNEKWVKRYDGPAYSDSRASAIALDSSGNVYVTGITSRDYATVKYDTNGNEEWVARYNGPGNSADQANAIAVDSAGNVYVTGVSLGIGTSDDYATIKYSQDVDTTVPFDEFAVTKAKIDFKKKPDDDKVRVEGKLEINTVNGDGVDIFDEVTFNVGPLSETITMVEKGKKGEKWEYKRPKGGTGDIKHMKIDWKKGTFDIHMDKVDLTEVTNPVTISIQIGDYWGTESITMKEHKHHWDYRRDHGRLAKIVSGNAYDEELTQIPEKYTLDNNYPNPFNPSTTISYAIPAGTSEHVSLKVYDLRGALVRTIVNEIGNPGTHSVVWDGTDESGNRVSSGVYIYQLKAGKFTGTKRMLFIK